MKLNKLLGLAVALAAVNSLSAAIDPDIQGKNGLALKQYAQQLKGLTAKPHHTELADPVAYDTEKLIESIGSTASAPYITAELPKAKARVKAYLDACMDGNNDPTDEFLLAVVPGGGVQPADTTYGAFITAFDAAFDAAVTSVTIAEAGPVSAKLSVLADCQERIDGKVAALIIPWFTGLHAGGLANDILHGNCQADGNAANGGTLGDAPGGIQLADLLAGVQGAIIIH